MDHFMFNRLHKEIKYSLLNLMPICLPYLYVLHRIDFLSLLKTIIEYQTYCNIYSLLFNQPNQ